VFYKLVTLSIYSGTLYGAPRHPAGGACGELSTKMVYILRQGRGPGKKKAALESIDVGAEVALGQVELDLRLEGGVTVELQVVGDLDELGVRSAHSRFQTEQGGLAHRKP